MAVAVEADRLRRNLDGVLVPVLLRFDRSATGDGLMLRDRKNCHVILPELRMANEPAVSDFPLRAIVAVGFKGEFKRSRQRILEKQAVIAVARDVRDMIRMRCPPGGRIAASRGLWRRPRAPEAEAGREQCGL